MGKHQPEFLSTNPHRVQIKISGTYAGGEPKMSLRVHGVMGIQQPYWTETQTCGIAGRSKNLTCLGEA